MEDPQNFDDDSFAPLRARSFGSDSQKPASDPASRQEDSSSRRRSTASNPRDEFNGPLVPAQFKLPQDLVQSLKLHAISSNRSMSEIVLECLTSPETVGKAWVSTRRAG